MDEVQNEEAPAETTDEQKSSNIDFNKNVEKVLTELLLQCEFCNRTYADKRLLLAHQKTHSTEANYECVLCKEVFDSYTTAAKHWLTKCTDEANLFYLPKLTYCEYCDRTFKSHEILYTHKIKKKHYTPKPHASFGTLQPVKNEEKLTENKDVIVRLIEDVLTTLSASLNKINAENNAYTEENNSNIGENRVYTEENKEDTPMQATEAEAVPIKTEVVSSANTTSDVIDAGEEPEKKKRGRKRKWPKQGGKGKRVPQVVDEGFKYQCERCVKVWDSVVELEGHRDKEHAANFTCDECGQVRFCFLCLGIVF